MTRSRSPRRSCALALGGVDADDEVLVAAGALSNPHGVGEALDDGADAGERGALDHTLATAGPQRPDADLEPSAPRLDADGQPVGRRERGCASSDRVSDQNGVVETIEGKLGACRMDADDPREHRTHERADGDGHARPVDAVERGEPVVSHNAHYPATPWVERSRRDAMPAVLGAPEPVRGER